MNQSSNQELSLLCSLGFMLILIVLALFILFSNNTSNIKTMDCDTFNLTYSERF